MRYRLRTLLFLLAVVPPLLAWYGWPALRKWPQKQPLPPAIPSLAPATTPQPQFVVYNIGNTDPTEAIEKAVSAKLRGSGMVRMQYDYARGRLAVWGTPAVHEAVRATLNDSFIREVMAGKTDVQARIDLQ